MIKREREREREREIEIDGNARERYINRDLTERQEREIDRDRVTKLVKVNLYFQRK